MAESKIDTIVRLLSEGNISRQELLEKADCTPKSLASYLASMRTAAKISKQPICPIEEVNDEGDKVLRLGSYEEYQEQQEAKAANKKSAKALTPEERFERAEKRVTRCTNMAASAKERAEADPDNRELQLRAQKAEIELELAHIEYDRANVALSTNSSPEAVTEASDTDEDDELM